jgi:alpha-ketoglutarate-dependent taurine dioxygenase
MTDISVAAGQSPAAAGKATLGFINDAQLPAVLRPLSPGRRGPADAAALLAVPETRALLARHGALLLRGFALKGEEDFAQFVTLHYGVGTGDYRGGLSPRVTVREGLVYESTILAARLRIHQHNEMAYLPRPPRDLVFFCERPSPVGGATPLTDCRRLLADMPQEVRDTLTRRGLRYCNHFYGRLWSPGNRVVNWFTKLHRSWRDAFSARRKEDVTQRCRELGVNLAWMWDGSARTTRQSPATTRHPASGEEVWFNQAHTQLITARVYGWGKFLGYHLIYPIRRYRPFDATFGDGSRLPRRYLASILDAMDRNTVTFDWQAGDLLWVDNFLCAHGRMPFQGPRRILVAIGPPTGRDI